MGPVKVESVSFAKDTLNEELNKTAFDEFWANTM
jgi:hypothetical protein